MPLRRLRWLRRQRPEGLQGAVQVLALHFECYRKWGGLNFYMCMYVCIYIYIHMRDTHLYTYIHMYMYIHIYIYICLHLSLFTSHVGGAASAACGMPRIVRKFHISLTTRL